MAGAVCLSRRVFRTSHWNTHMLGQSHKSERIFYFSLGPIHTGREAQMQAMEHAVLIGSVHMGDKQHCLQNCVLPVWIGPWVFCLFFNHECLNQKQLL